MLVRAEVIPDIARLIVPDDGLKLRHPYKPIRCQAAPTSGGCAAFQIFQQFGQLLFGNGAREEEAL